MLVLGIESTAHTLGIGVVRDGDVLGHALDMYRAPKGEGILPRKAADHHANCFKSVLKQALKNAGVDDLGAIDLFAFSQGPGIGAPLRVSAVAARYLAACYKKPIVGVNHCLAHLMISKHLSGFSDPLYAYVSGGNTQIIVQQGKRFRVLGETLDIGMGNLFDVFARSLGLEHGHGAALAKLATKGHYVDLGYTIKGMDMVFCGLLTAAEKKIGIVKDEDLAFSVMHTAFAIFCEACERALHLTKKNELVLCGGVAQNRDLQKMMRIMCEENNLQFYVAPDEYNRDNGAMIAHTGWLLRHRATYDVEQWCSKQDYRIDAVEL